MTISDEFSSKIMMKKLFIIFCNNIFGSIYNTYFFSLEQCET